MMFIVRVRDGGPRPPLMKMIRRTPPIVPDSAGMVDFFCVGDPDAARATGITVVPVHDGWYADDIGGGVAIWGQGLYWEVRETPFRVKEACGPANKESSAAEDDVVNVRAAIFQG